MAKKTPFGLMIEMDKYKIYLDKKFDLTHGKRWFSRVSGDDSYQFGFAFNKENKFTAVKEAIKNYEHNVDHS